MKKRYGFDARYRNFDPDPWVNLKTINEYLEDSLPIPPDLAQWLGHAICYSGRSGDELLRRLGLKESRGRPRHKHAQDAPLKWGKRVSDLEDSGSSAEEAIALVQSEYALEHGDEPARSLLQKWRDEYRDAWREAHCR